MSNALRSFLRLEFLFLFTLFTWGFVNVKATKTAFVPTYTGREKTARFPSSSSSSSFANILNNSIMVLPKINFE